MRNAHRNLAPGFRHADWGTTPPRCTTCWPAHVCFKSLAVADGVCVINDSATHFDQRKADDRVGPDGECITWSVRSATLLAGEADEVCCWRLLDMALHDIAAEEHLLFALEQPRKSQHSW